MESVGFTVLEELIKYGAVRDFVKTPHTGKGKKPTSNISLVPVTIQAMRISQDKEEQFYGMIGIFLMTDSDTSNMSTRLTNLLKKFCEDYNTENLENFHKNFLYICQETRKEYLKRKG
jgi:hypothetical protein